MLSSTIDCECTNHDESTQLLAKTLTECRSAAITGYKIASEHEKKLSHALENAANTVRTTLLQFSGSSCYSPEATKLMQTQLSEIESSFAHLSSTFKEDLENLHSNLSKFSITLFGRTMTGKSTLMEVLTEGDGSSIGKGAQRTTRDIRQYMWNGLEITDVPGIGAFEGEEDELLAFHAAKTADLILYLITDDAPQANDAEHFSRIVDLGKPVICVVNVKASVSEGKSIRLTTRDIQKRFDRDRLEDIRNQFLKYAECCGQTWNHIPFIYVHLKSAYMSQCEENPEIAKQYYKISRIDYLKRRIIELVRDKGRFMRVKTFVDIISNPMLESMEKLLDQRWINSIQGRTILAKKRQLAGWRESFSRDGANRISSLIVRIRSELDSEISAFAEEHFSDKDAGKAWASILKDCKLEKRCQSLLKDLESTVNDQINTFSREVASELNFSVSFAENSTIRANVVWDTKKVWDWSILLIGGGLSIATGIAILLGSALAGPLGWASLAVGGIGTLGSKFFKSREKKEREARIALEKKLRKDVAQICSSLEDQMLANFEALLSVRIDDLLKEIDKLNSVLFRLADTQKKLAWDLCSHLLELNRDIAVEAMKLTGADDFEAQVLMVARIPGKQSIFVVRDRAVFSQDIRESLYKLMAERINFIFESESPRILISRTIGKSVDRAFINIEEKLGLARIPLTEITPDLENRIRLAQQISQIQIIKQ